jgi:hypothetical protein
MFRTVFSSIIRSLRLYILHQAYFRQILWLLATVASENEMELLVPSRSLQQAVCRICWHKPDDVCTVLDSWWWTERPSEACRVILQNKINLEIWWIWLVLLLKSLSCLWMKIYRQYFINNIICIYDFVYTDVHGSSSSTAYLRSTSPQS